MEKIILVLFLYIQHFELVFVKKNFDILLDYQRQNHTIKLISRTKSKLSKVYLLLSVEQTELNNFLIKNLHTDRICSSKFSTVVPVFFIKKKNSFLWLVQDYRILNTITIKNKYSLLLISRLILQLQGAKYFTKLNVC